MKRCRPALGTYVEIEVRGIGAAAETGTGSTSDGESAAAAAIDRAFAAIGRVEARMSFHRDTSDLARINRARAGDRVVLDPWTVEVLALAVELHAATDGLFDCAVGEELIASGLLPGRPSGKRSGSIGDLEIVDARSVRLRHATCLDLGGIAKGYAVDRAVDALVGTGQPNRNAQGDTRGSVNAGGDLRVFGRDARTIHVESPGEPGRLVEAGRLCDGAIATSSTRHTGAWGGGRWRSALVDPRTGRSPPPAARSYSVLAARCAVADALTKPLALAGELSAECRRRYGAIALIL